MNHRFRKATIATLVMGTSMLGMAGVTFAGTSTTTSASTPFWTDITTGGSIRLPRGIAVDSAGDLFVTNYVSNTIEERKSGSTTWTDITNGGLFKNPTGIAVDSAGDLFVANQGNNTILERKSGSLTWTNITHGGSFAFPTGIAVDSKGDVFVANKSSGYIDELKSGSATWTDINYNGNYQTFGGPAGIAVDQAGNVFVTNSSFNDSVVELLSGSAKWVNITNGAPFDKPYGIAVDQAGNVFVTDLGPETKIWERKLGSSTWTNISNGGSYSDFTGIATDPSGDLFVANFSGPPYVEEHVPPVAPSLNTLPTAAAGTVAGTTAVTATTNTAGDTLEYALSTQSITVPLLNSQAPSLLPTSTVVSIQKSNIVSNAQVGDYVGVYEVAPSTNQVVAFSQVGPLTSSDIGVVNAGIPTIATTPSSLTETIGQTPKALSLSSVTVRDAGTLSYQWYRNGTDSNTGGSAIPGAMSTSYIPPTTTVGTTYYYVIVTDTNNSVNGKTTEFSTSSAIPVTVTKSSTDTLSSLTVSKGFLSPAFTSQVTSYTDQVDSSVSSLALSPTVTDPTASVTVSVYGNPVSSSSGLYVVPLQTGDTPIDVKVTAKDGTNKTYIVDVQKASAPLTGQLPEVPFAAGLPLLVLAGGGVVWFVRRRKGNQA